MRAAPELLAFWIWGAALPGVMKQERQLLGSGYVFLKRK